MMNRRRALTTAMVGFAAFGSAMTRGSAATLEGDGIVMAKSAYGFDETDPPMSLPNRAARPSRR